MHKHLKEVREEVMRMSEDEEHPCQGNSKCKGPEARWFLMY